MKKRIALITSDQQRHRWVAAQLTTFSELVSVVSESKPIDSQARSDNRNREIARYFEERERRESFWFAEAPHDMAELGIPILRCGWGQGNSPSNFNFLAKEDPELVFLFGCSIIRAPILSYYKGRIINMHLGLSPYYRGSSTNFWPLVDGLPECVGVTVHHAAYKVDGGNILLQARPDVTSSDSSHDLGCKSIIAGASLIRKVVENSTGMVPGAMQSGGGKLCSREDFNLGALRRMQKNFAEGMIADYVQAKERRDREYPITEDAFK